MAFTVLIQPRARSDIAAVVAWLSRHDPNAAARWRAGLLSSVVAKLEADPNR
jgi:hypothetical protein